MSKPVYKPSKALYYTADEVRYLRIMAARYAGLCSRICDKLSIVPPPPYFDMAESRIKAIEKWLRDKVD